MDALLAIFVGLVLVSLYFVPTSVAFNRAHNNRLAIFCANVLLGWTGLGWALCLIWACTSNTQPKKPGDSFSP